MLGARLLTDMRPWHAQFPAMKEGACALSSHVCAEHADPDDPLRVTDDTRFLGLIVSVACVACHTRRCCSGAGCIVVLGENTNGPAIAAGVQRDSCHAGGAQRRHGRDRKSLHGAGMRWSEAAHAYCTGVELPPSMRDRIYRSWMAVRFSDQVVATCTLANGPGGNDQ